MYELIDLLFRKDRRELLRQLRKGVTLESRKRANLLLNKFTSSELQDMNTAALTVVKESQRADMTALMLLNLGTFQAPSYMYIQ